MLSSDASQRNIRINGLPLIVIQELNKIWMLSFDASQRNISYVQAGKRGFPQLDWNLKISWSLKVCKGSEKQIRGYISQENGKEKYRENNTHTHTHTHTCTCI